MNAQQLAQSRGESVEDYLQWEKESLKFLSQAYLYSEETQHYRDITGRVVATVTFPVRKPRGHRCAYCACKVRLDMVHCGSCGAPL